MAPHPHSQCRADLRRKAEMKWLESFGSSLVLSSAVGLSLSHGPGGFGWAHAKTIFSKVRMCVEHGDPSLGRSPGWGDGQRGWFTPGHSMALLPWTFPWPLEAKQVGIDACVHANVLFETTWVYGKPPGTECCVSPCNKTEKNKLCYIFHIDFSFSLVQHFQLKWQQTEAQNGEKNVLSYTTGKRAWISDFVSMLSN